MDINLQRPGPPPNLGKVFLIPGILCILLGVGVFVDKTLLQWLVGGAFLFVGLLLVLVGLKFRKGPPMMMPPGFGG